MILQSSITILQLLEFQYYNYNISILQLSIPLINFTWKYNKRLGIRTVNKFSMTRISKSLVESELRLLKSTGLDDLPPGLLKDWNLHIETTMSYFKFVY